MKRTMLPIALLSTLLVAAVAYADLKPFQKAAQTKFNEEVKDSHAAAEKACGAKIKVKTDFSGLKQKEWEGNSISSRCTAVLDALAAICGDEAYKPEVAKNIKTVECRFGGKDGDTAQNMKVQKGTFTFAMHVNNGNLDEAAKKVIKTALDGE
jgi:hypothetical protein